MGELIRTVGHGTLGPETCYFAKWTAGPRAQNRGAAVRLAGTAEWGSQGPAAIAPATTGVDDKVAKTFTSLPCDRKGGFGRGPS